MEPYTLGGGTKLKLAVTLSSKRNVLKQKGLVLHAKCNAGCAIGAIGHVSIKGTRKPFNTKQEATVGRANRSVSLVPIIKTFRVTR